ncbi:hypothetical protein QFZ77_005896 [Paenibacillus sp. V4I3]|nr:hypothetical protein [Paenibacillus sp. V4I3]MDQ0886884.1 hypothetical protein [Paenibacillus sp. V4I9]
MSIDTDRIVVQQLRWATVITHVVVSTTIHTPKGYFVSKSCSLYTISNPFVAKWPVRG